MTDSSLPRIPDAIDARRLAAMELVAKMRAQADRMGTGFIGGFIDPTTGEKFVMSNMDDDELVRRLTERMPGLPPAADINPWDDPLG